MPEFGPDRTSINHKWGTTERRRLFGENFYFTSISTGKAKQRADIFEKLYNEYGPFEIPNNSDSVPLSVSLGGNVAICGYLYSVKLFSKSKLSDLLSVREATIEQYLSDVRNGTRI